jgi:hypothetical protein
MEYDFEHKMDITELNCEEGMRAMIHYQFITRGG